MINDVTVIIPTYNRANTLNKCLWSLSKNTFLPEKVLIVDANSTDNTLEIVKNYKNKLNIEILKSEKGLIKQMNNALKKVETEIFIRTDDDVIFSKNWILSIKETFYDDPNIVGVTGPTIIPRKYKNNRDLLRSIFNKNLKYYLLNFFCDYRLREVGYFSSCGFFSVGTNFFESKKLPKQKVEYLEACNYAMRVFYAKDLGGFSDKYGAIGEYNEPDLCFRILEKHEQAKYIYNPESVLYHCPSVQGFFSSRIDYKERLSNFFLFMNNHIIKKKNFNKFKSIIYIIIVNFFFVLKSTINLKFRYNFIIISLKQILYLIHAK